jgi:hypothetical protein
MLHYIIAFLFTPLFAGLWPIPGPNVNRGGGGNPCASYLVCQNLETSSTGYDNGESWTESGTINHAYTGVILRGTQSLRLTGASSYTFTTYASQSHVYSYCDWELKSVPSVLNPFGIHLGGASADTYIEIDNSAGIRLFSGGGASAPSGSTISLSTKYHLWLEHLNNGTCVLAMSTTTTKPSVDGGAPGGDVFLTKTGDAGNVDHIYAQEAGSGELIMDHILVSTTVIGNNP